MKSHSNKTNFTWTSSNTGVATIDETTGSLTTKGKGTTTITVTAPNGKTGTCTITVNQTPSTPAKSECFYATPQIRQVLYCNGSITRTVCTKFAEKIKWGLIEICYPVVKTYTQRVFYPCYGLNINNQLYKTLCHYDKKTTHTTQECEQEYVETVKPGDCVEWATDIIDRTDYSGSFPEDCKTHAITDYSCPAGYKVLGSQCCS